MLRLSATLDDLFTDLPLLARFPAARAAGFDRVSLRNPYGLSIQELDHALTRHHLQLAVIATPLGDPEVGEYGFMGVPRRIADFRQGFEKAMEYAAALEVEIIQLMAGIADPARSEKMLTRNLAWAAYNAPDRTLTLGPSARPGYAIQSLDHAAKLIDWIGAPNLALEATEIRETPLFHWENTAHIQLSEAPDPNLLNALKQAHYEGIVSTKTAQPTA